jgi:flagellar hook assembly protein FlgD
VAQQQVTSFGLDAPYPNPFNSEVVIRFSLPQATAASVAVYNMAGQKVRTLETGYLESGSYRFVWDGLNDNGHGVATGIYFVRLQAGVQSRVQKITLLR